jgi:hypothetical protein
MPAGVWEGKFELAEAHSSFRRDILPLLGGTLHTTGNMGDIDGCYCSFMHGCYFKALDAEWPSCQALLKNKIESATTASRRVFEESASLTPYRWPVHAVGIAEEIVLCLWGLFVVTVSRLVDMADGPEIVDTDLHRLPFGRAFLGRSFES